MIYPKEPFYVVSGFSPIADRLLSRYSFSIGLKTDFAMKCLDKEMTDSAYDKLDNRRNEILKLIDLDFGPLGPYQFFENEKGKTTCLLRWCQVPGNACDLGIDGREVDSIMNKKFINDMIIYGPHNVDCMGQAYGLLSIWLTWADFAYAVTREK